MKLVAILRVKDEILVIEECLNKLSSLVDEIIILDNGSTDGSLDIYKSFPKIVKILNTVGFHEGRDKRILLQEAKTRNPDWITWIDGDEIFEKNLTRSVLEKYMNSSYNKVDFKLCHFWLNKKRIRIDGTYFAYTVGSQRSMWRNLSGTSFSNKNIHNGNIRGVYGKNYISPYRLKHYGCINREKLQEKYERCLREDQEGKRNYPKKNFDANASVITIKFLEFDNPKYNYIYIQFYKYITELIHHSILLQRKLRSFFICCSL